MKRHPNNKKVEITCVICGIKKEFSPTHVSYPKRNYIRKCCSKKCMYKYLSVNYSGENSRSGFKNASLKRNCTICKKSFKETKSRVKDGRGKYCGRECYNKGMRLRRGSETPNWLGGRIKTEIIFKGYAWWRKLRNEIYARDNWTCQLCGVKCNNKQGPLKIQCDHKLPRIMGGTHDKSNLWTLCNRCHGIKDSHIRFKYIKPSLFI